MKIDQPGVYCFWNKINNKVYVGSAQDLPTRLNQHFNNKKSNTPLQDEIKEYGIEAFHISQVITETHTAALELEQQCLDYLFKKNKPKYNLSRKVGGGKVRESYANHGELSAQNNGHRAKPFFIKDYPSGKILLKAKSTCDKKAQEFLKMSQSQISSRFNSIRLLLFIKLNSGQIIYLDYVDQSLSERAKILGRSIESDYNKIAGFHLEKPTLSLKHKDGRKAFLENYKTYYEAGRMLGLNNSQLTNFCAMASGRIMSAYGWSLTV